MALRCSNSECGTVLTEGQNFCGLCGSRGVEKQEQQLSSGVQTGDIGYMEGNITNNNSRSKASVSAINVHVGGQQLHAEEKIVLCPICGKRRQLLETFKCRSCSRDHLCQEHQDPAEFICIACVKEQTAQRQREEEAERERARRALLPNAGRNYTEPQTGIEMVWVPEGAFDMGDIFGDGGAAEKPVHRVELDGFWIGKYPVTQGQYLQITGNNPSHFNKGDDYPVEEVSWDDAQRFLEQLNSLSNLSFRLPTEAEWEYAARSGGKNEEYAGGADVNAVGWHDENSDGSTQPVGRKAANGLGIHDMSGNVWEWCQDWYGEDYYSSSPRNNPQGPSSGSYRVIRGGSWSLNPRNLRSANRNRFEPDNRYYNLGFRLVLPVQQAL